MAIKYADIFDSKIFPNWDFWYANVPTIWQPWSELSSRYAYGIQDLARFKPMNISVFPDLRQLKTGKHPVHQDTGRAMGCRRHQVKTHT
jgi:hypothetical protein